MTSRAGIRDHYAHDPRGATGFYERAGATYRNPHETAVRAGLGLAASEWPELWAPSTRWLDLCCGSGEVTAALLDAGVDAAQVSASDPYTGDAFVARCGRPVDATWTFADLAAGAAGHDRFDVLVCSYALHLCEASRLPAVCAQLALAASTLLVLTPHKRPVLRAEWGWTLTGELHDPATRVRVRRHDRAA